MLAGISVVSCEALTTGSGWSGFWSCHRELGNHSGLEVLVQVGIWETISEECVRLTDSKPKVLSQSTY
jgi:hypothetical protein